MPFLNQSSRFNPIPNELRICSGSVLKLIAVITMLIDHFGAGFVYALMMMGQYPFGMDPGQFYVFYRTLRSIGRIAFPIFCFLVVEGLLHTSSKWRYLLRMTAFAFISELPFDLALSMNFAVNNPNANSLHILQALAASKQKVLAQQNVFFTLSIGLAVIICTEFFFRYAEKFSRDYLWKIQKKTLPASRKKSQESQNLHRVSSNVCDDKAKANSFANGSVSDLDTHQKTQHSVMRDSSVNRSVAISPAYTALTIVMYLLAAVLSFAALYIGCIAANILGTDYKWVGVMLIAVLYLLRKNVPMSAVVGYVFLSNFQVNEMWAFPGFILMALYNEKRGFIKGTAAKYFFYAFYPLHLFLIYLLRVILL